MRYSAADWKTRRRASWPPTERFTEPPYPQAIGGLSVIDVPSREEALEWAAAVACRCSRGPRVHARPQPRATERDGAFLLRRSPRRLGSEREGVTAASRLCHSTPVDARRGQKSSVEPEPPLGWASVRECPPALGRPEPRALPGQQAVHLVRWPRRCHVAKADPIADYVRDYRAFAAMQRDRLSARGIDIAPYALGRLASASPIGICTSTSGRCSSAMRGRTARASGTGVRSP